MTQNGLKPNENEENIENLSQIAKKVHEISVSF